MYEIINEKIYDLLDKDRNLYNMKNINNISNTIVFNESDMVLIFDKTNEKRTKYSHCIININIKKTNIKTGDILNGTLKIVDLFLSNNINYNSDNSIKSLCEIITQISINQSRNIISPIKFNSSILSNLLKPCLCDNYYTCFILCCSLLEKDRKVFCYNIDDIKYINFRRFYKENINKP